MLTITKARTHHAVHRILFAILALMMLAPALPVSAAGSSTTPVWVGAPFRGAYAGTNNRPAGSLPGRHTPVYTVPGYNYTHDWSMDFYAPAGTDVMVFAAPKNSVYNNEITAQVLSVRAACGSGVIGNGGYVVIVGIVHAGVRVGSVAYAHVNPDFDRNGVTNSTDISFRGTVSRWGGYIGKVGSYVRNSCWDVGTTNGHHVHVEFANVKNYACYRDLAPGSVISQGEFMGYVGGAYASAKNKPCPAGV